MFETVYPVIAENELILLDQNVDALPVRVRYLHCDLQNKFSTAQFSLELLLKEWEKCTIQTKKLIKHGVFFQTRFFGCTFLGKYHDCRFGFNPRYYQGQQQENAGMVLDCDFSKAFLHLVSFFCDIGETKLPGWPFFTIYRPSEETDFFDRNWPSGIGKEITSSKKYYWSDPKLVCYVCHAPTFIKEYAPDVGLDELKSVLSRYDFVRL